MRARRRKSPMTTIALAFAALFAGAQSFGHPGGVWCHRRSAGIRPQGWGKKTCFSTTSLATWASSSQFLMSELRRPLRLCASKDDGDGAEEDSGQSASEMEELILSLSMEPTDASRRERLASIFTTELAKPNGAPKEFAETFDAALQKVGTEVQIAAREKALWKQTGGDEGEGGGDNEEGDAGSGPEATASGSLSEGESGEDYMNSGGKSAEEQQLWALVDMMVQSKTLVKKAEGSLGSEGAYS